MPRRLGVRRGGAIWPKTPFWKTPRCRIIDFGLTADDLGPRQFGAAAARAPRRDLRLPFAAATRPKPSELADEPDPSDPLPQADVLVVTWTAAEMLALADVLTPSVNPRTKWYRYDRHFEEYLPTIRKGAPARVGEPARLATTRRRSDRRRSCA